MLGEHLALFCEVEVKKKNEFFLSNDVRSHFKRVRSMLKRRFAPHLASETPAVALARRNRPRISPNVATRVLTRLFSVLDLFAKVRPFYPHSHPGSGLDAKRPDGESAVFSSVCYLWYVSILAAHASLFRSSSSGLSFVLRTSALCVAALKDSPDG